MQVAQREPGSVISVLGTNTYTFRAKYVLLTGLGAGPMAPMRAWMFASIELSTGGMGRPAGSCHGRVGALVTMGRDRLGRHGGSVCH